MQTVTQFRRRPTNILKSSMINILKAKRERPSAGVISSLVLDLETPETSARRAIKTITMRIFISLSFSPLFLFLSQINRSTNIFVQITRYMTQTLISRCVNARYLRAALNAIAPNYFYSRTRRQINRTDIARMIYLARAMLDVLDLPCVGTVVCLRDKVRALRVSKR